MFFRAVFVVFWRRRRREKKKKKHKKGGREKAFNGKRKDTKCDSTRFVTDDENS